VNTNTKEREKLRTVNAVTAGRQKAEPFM